MGKRLAWKALAVTLAVSLTMSICAVSAFADDAAQDEAEEGIAQTQVGQPGRVDRARLGRECRQFQQLGTRTYLLAEEETESAVGFRPRSESNRRRLSHRRGPAMRKLAFQWRITLMTALMIACSCFTLNILLFFSGSYYIESVGEYMMEIDDEDFLEAIESGKPNESLGEDAVVFELSDDQYEQFQSNFSQELHDTKAGFWVKGWLLTILVTIISSVIAYFVAGYCLRPLKKLSEQTKSIHTENLANARLEETNIPEFKALAESINEMLERLQDGFKAQRQFAGNAAHELRTPLALVRTKIDLLEEEHPDMPEDMAASVSALSEQVDRLSQLVRTLLDMSELETVPRTDLIELSSLIGEVVDDLTPLAEQEGITLSHDCESVIVQGSDILLNRAIFNLVENAIKYNIPGGSVAVALKTGPSQAIIRVNDTGPGIPDCYRDSVFQPFFRIDKSRSRSLGGVGLGLSLVWEIANLHGGSVKVENTGEGGTTVALAIPKQRIDRSE